MDQVSEQLRGLLSFVGAAIAAWIGLWARHATDPSGFNWQRLLTETPVALFCGIIAGAIGSFSGLEALVVYGIASFAAYISPPIFFAILKKYVERKNGPTD